MFAMRMDRIKTCKGFVAREPVRGHMVNVVKGLKVFEDIFTESELLKISEFINELRLAGHRGELSGKTMVARVLGYILHKLGLISINKVIEVQRTDLVGGYVGQTGLKTREKIDEAKGGILFVDEAYRLMPTDSRRDFGIEALEEIMQAMDNGEVVTIFAGYGKDMEHMISANEGFPRRVSKLGKLKCKDADDSVQDVKADDLRQMFLAMTEEVRVIIVKLADRLHNMRTLAHMPQHKQSSIALETLQVFAPLAKLLGMYQIKSELEYLSFMYTNAYDFTELKKRVDGLYKEHERELQEANKILRQGMEKDKFLELVTVKTEVHSVCKELYRFAEMPKEEKNKISHRSKALALVKSHFASAGNEFQTDGEP